MLIQETLLDHKPFLLSGGMALLDGKTYPLPTERGVLLKVVSCYMTEIKLTPSLLLFYPL